MEDVVRVGTYVDCFAVTVNPNMAYSYLNVTLVHNALGCQFIEIFQFMYNLNVSYIFFGPEIEDSDVWSLLNNGSIDVYARPAGIRDVTLVKAQPIHALFKWKIGFILHRERRQRMLRKFYSKPFSTTVWVCLDAMAILASLLFFVLSRWERRLGNNGESSYVFELMLAIGGVCQHVFPVETISLSRRTAYFTFFLFTYTMYTFYTSNLLSHLVSDKESDMTLVDLEHSGYNYMFLEGIKEYQSKISALNMTGIMQQLQHIPIVNMSTGLEAVRQNRTALLSDYSMVYKSITKSFSTKEICNLIQIDLFSSIQKYLFTSKMFRYNEQIKISALRMQETGILKRLTTTNTFTPPECSPVMEVTTSIEQISSLLLLFICCYIAAFLILVCERMHYKRYRVYPYVD